MGQAPRVHKTLEIGPIKVKVNGTAWSESSRARAALSSCLLFPWDMLEPRSSHWGLRKGSTGYPSLRASFPTIKSIVERDGSAEKDEI